MIKFQPCVATALLVLACSFANGQAQTIPIDPAATGTGIQTVHGPHLAFYNPAVKHVDKLLLFIVGTNGNASDWKRFCEYAADKGYNVISIDYMNTVITTTCVESKDSTCFDGFRQEIMFGTPASELVQVDSVNSIYHRTLALLGYLKKNNPKQNWGQFLKGTGINWTKVVAAGHSQGAGHVVVLGKLYSLHRVVILAGPQDWLSVFHSPAPWLKQKTTTPVGSYFACLHVKDPYQFNRQLANCNAIMMNQPTDTLMVSPGIPISRKSQIFVANNETADPHGAFQNEAFKPVWDYLLRP